MPITSRRYSAVVTASISVAHPQIFVGSFKVSLLVEYDHLFCVGCSSACRMHWLGLFWICFQSLIAFLFLHAPPVSFILLQTAFKHSRARQSQQPRQQTAGLDCFKQLFRVCRCPWPGTTGDQAECPEMLRFFVLVPRWGLLWFWSFVYFLSAWPAFNHPSCKFEISDSKFNLLN